MGNIESAATRWTPKVFPQAFPPPGFLLSPLDLLQRRFPGSRGNFPADFCHQEWIDFHLTGGRLLHPRGQHCGDLCVSEDPVLPGGKGGTLLGPHLPHLSDGGEPSTLGSHHGFGSFHHVQGFEGRTGVLGRWRQRQVQAALRIQPCSAASSPGQRGSPPL